MAKKASSFTECRLAGVTYPNEDGSSRQHELACCHVGEHVTLRPEPHNPHDDRAVAVLSARAIQIGYLSHDDADWILDCQEQGERLEARIDALFGGSDEKPQIGAVIEVSHFEDNDDA